MGDEDYGIDPKVIGRLAREIIEAQQAGAEIVEVEFGGNLAASTAALAPGGTIAPYGSVANGQPVLDFFPFMFGNGTIRGVFVYAMAPRSEEHTSELPSPMRISYAVFCLKQKNTYTNTAHHHHQRIQTTP